MCVRALLQFLHRSDDILMRVDTLQNFLCEVYHREEPSAAFKMAGFTRFSCTFIVNIYIQTISLWETETLYQQMYNEHDIILRLACH